MSRDSIEVLYEDNHLLAIGKPANLATMGVTADSDSLVVRVKAYLKQRYDKPGNVYLGVVSRLDAVVTGVVLFARTSKAAARLTDQFRQRQVHKTYWALVSGTVTPSSATLRDYVVKDDLRQRMVICSGSSPGAKEAVLHYETISHPSPNVTLLQVRLETGRKHQIRLQLAQHGYPIVGDRKYGSSLPFPRGIALHACRLQLLHPVQKVPLDLCCAVPAYWPRRN
jgi:23S rRNA pseudouridine1911/1915/1917 synthase